MVASSSSKPGSASASSPLSLLRLPERFPLGTLQFPPPFEHYESPSQERYWNRVLGTGSPRYALLSATCRDPRGVVFIDIGFRAMKSHRIDIATWQQDEPIPPPVALHGSSARSVPMVNIQIHCSWLDQRGRRLIARVVRQRVHDLARRPWHTWTSAERQRAREALHFPVTENVFPVITRPELMARLATRRLRRLRLIYVRQSGSGQGTSLDDLGTSDGASRWILAHADLEGRAFEYRHQSQIVLLHRTVEQPAEQPIEQRRVSAAHEGSLSLLAQLRSRKLRVALTRALARQLGLSRELPLLHRLPPQKLRELEQLLFSWAMLAGRRSS